MIGGPSNQYRVAHAESGRLVGAAGWGALGAALDDIRDFDWQPVRDFVGAVTGAREWTREGEDDTLRG